MDELSAYERRFRRAGLPLFIEGYTATGDVFTRAWPLLALVFLAEMLGAIDLDWPLAANVAAAATGLAILLGAFAASNRLRGRAGFAPPERIGKTELALFVVLPALLPLIFGGQERSAVVTGVGNGALLLLVYGVVGYGLISTLRWGSVRLLSELALSIATLARAVPLLLLFALVLFMTTEMWQVAASVSPGVLALSAALLVGFGTLFLIAQLPGEVRALEHEAAPERPLSRRQRLNVASLMFVSHALQVLIVSAATGAFFAAFGALAVTAEVREAWLGSAGDVIVGVDVLGERAEVTEELLRVAGAIAAFSGLYYAIAVLTDQTYRAQFLDRLTRELADVFRARNRYLDLRAGLP